MHEKILRATTVFDGKLIHVETRDVELEDGRRAYREVVRHPGAVALIVRRSDGAFVFVKQFRSGIQRIMLEVVAGLLDPGEAPETAAVRELREETGYVARSLVPIGEVYPTPGYVDERIVLFAAEVDAAPASRELDHDERIEVVTLSADAFRALLRTGDVQDGKTLAAWALYEARGRAG
jgi:ADP-ribose pyrophosphatase